MCKCEFLFCYQTAVARLTVPHIKPLTLVCEQHLSETLERNARYRKILGAVAVDRLTPSAP